MTFAGVRAMGLQLPGTEEGTSWGTPALKVGGRMFACIASHKSAEPNTLVVYMDIAQRDALIEEDPKTYYLKDHYVNYPVVLVRLARVRPDAMRDLLAGAWRIVNGRAGPRRRTSTRRSTSPRSTRRR
ncbi:MAG TPA: MmcQ/YjbR family DNA-binding protein [Vicinamibacterales bacterium]|nr:MmcQ/YjbR family DNA-binding protein [Vicinamibacterales bacterium]